MDNREETFKKKFECAATHLGVKPKQVISLKMRDMVTSYSDYRDLVESLKKEAGFQCTDINNGLQGRGYLLEDKESKIIIVEHESGVEILYIASAVVTLIQFIPWIFQKFKNIRNDLSRRNDLDHIEIRRLDNNGHLLEEYDHEMYEVLIGSLSLALSEIKKAMENVKKLTLRVDKIEKQIMTKKKRKK